MHRTILANKACPEFLENNVTQNQYPPEAVRIFAIVGGMLRILLEAHRIRHLAGHRPDFYLDSERPQCRHELSIELGHRSRLQFHCLRRAPTRLDDQLMLDEIELNLEIPVSIRNRRRRQAARVDIESDLPPVVDARTQRHPHLAYNLCPHMQRGVSILPRL